MKQKNNDLVTNVLHPELKSGVNSRDINTNINFNNSNYNINLHLLLGYECMCRNHLKKIESFNPRLYLVTYPTSMFIMEYGIIIDSDIGTGVWIGSQTNKLLMTKI